MYYNNIIDPVLLKDIQTFKDNRAVFIFWFILLKNFLKQMKNGKKYPIFFSYDRFSSQFSNAINWIFFILSQEIRNVLIGVFVSLIFFLCDSLFLSYGWFCIQQWITVPLWKRKGLLWNTPLTTFWSATIGGATFPDLLPFGVVWEDILPSQYVWEADACRHTGGLVEGLLQLSAYWGHSWGPLCNSKMPWCIRGFRGLLIGRLLIDLKLVQKFNQADSKYLNFARILVTCFHKHKNGIVFLVKKNGSDCIHNFLVDPEQNSKAIINQSENLKLHSCIVYLNKKQNLICWRVDHSLSGVQFFSFIFFYLPGYGSIKYKESKKWTSNTQRIFFWNLLS